MTKIYSLKNKKIWITGHNGMVGRALSKKFKKMKYKILHVDRKKLDLRIQSDVDQWIKVNKPEVIFHTAARVGGILENSTKPAMFISDNLQMQTNVITSAYKYDVDRLIFLGSACIYPINNKPIKESDLLAGKLESTNKSYSVAKISGIQMCNAFYEQYGVNYTSVQPNNLYGPNDNFSDDSAHVISSLIRKIHYAKINKFPSFMVWGSGNPKREFLYVDDLVDALLNITENYKCPEPINIGSGEEITIRKLSELIKKIVNYKGKLVFNKEYPDGVMRKFLDSRKIISMGWKPKVFLEEGLKKTYKWFLNNNT